METLRRREDRLPRREDSNASHVCSPHYVDSESPEHLHGEPSNPHLEPPGRNPSEYVYRALHRRTPGSFLSLLIDPGQLDQFLQEQLLHDRIAREVTTPVPDRAGKTTPHHPLIGRHGIRVQSVDRELTRGVHDDRIDLQDAHPAVPVLVGRETLVERYSRPPEQVRVKQEAVDGNAELRLPASGHVPQGFRHHEA